MSAFLAGHTNGLAFVIGFVILCATLVLLWLLDRVWLMLEDRRNERAHIEPTTYESSPYNRMPCKGRNANVCIAEGCYRNSCIKNGETDHDDL